MRRTVLSLVVLVLVSGSLIIAQEVASKQTLGSAVDGQREESPNPNYVKLPTTRVIVYIGYRRQTKPVTPNMQFYRAIIDPREIPDPGKTGRFVDYLCWGNDDVEVRVSRNPEDVTFNKYFINVSVGKYPNKPRYRGSAIVAASFENFKPRENLLHLQLSPVKDDLDYQVDARIGDSYFLDEFESPWDHHVVKDMTCKFQLIYDSKR